MRNYIVEIDGDPLDRKSPDGTWRPQLNDKERQILHRRSLANEVAEGIKAGKKFYEVAKELEIESKSLFRMLTYSDDPETRNVITDIVLSMLLNLEKDMNRVQIAEEIGITKGQLDLMMKQDWFKQRYTERFETLRTDPNIPLTQERIVQELLPKALKALAEALLPSAPWNVRQKAYQDVFKLAGVEAVEPQKSDKQEAVQFLKNAQVNITVEVPSDYQDALDKYSPDVVEGDVKELDE